MATFQEIFLRIDHCGALRHLTIGACNIDFFFFPFLVFDANKHFNLDAGHHLISLLPFYSKFSIIRPGRSRFLEFEKKIVLVV